MFNLFILILSLLTLSSSKPHYHHKEQPVCGYESCHPVKEGLINVHIVPHTHDDVGWLKTVDQYYYGSKSDIQKAGVQYILDSVTDALRRNPDRRFIYVETAYFWKWWTKQTDQIKREIHDYVQSGQLEFIGGAWSMNDEAATHYQSIVDQFTWGLRKLNDTFGACGRPKIGWQIDPFGHSREQASIFAQLGFDGLLLGRIDYQDKENRFNTRTPEIVWRASDSLGKAADLFTGVMYNTYSPPSGFCFDILCSDEPIIDDENSPDYNVDSRIDEFFEYLNNVTAAYSTRNVIITMGEDFNYQDANVWFKNLDKLIQYAKSISSSYATKNVLITMGGDFTYMDAEFWFKNIDKIIRYANERQKSVNGSQFNLIYSTPSCYIKAVHDEAEKNGQLWDTKSDDYFPYASDPHSYWTGYFTSRPTIKRFERIGNNYLQICKQLHALADLGNEDDGELDALREAMGVMQHHDAVTGTEKQQVAFDYARLLTAAMNQCDDITSKALSKLSKSTDGIEFSSCPLANISSCAFTENSKNFMVTIYNPLSRPVDHFVRFPVLGKAYAVTDDQGVQVRVDLIPIADRVLKVPGRKSEAVTDLIFKAEDLPPLGFKSYYVQLIEGVNSIKHESSMENEKWPIKLDVNESTGLISSLTMKNISIDLSQEFLKYEGYVGDNYEFEDRSSGAYIFRPFRSEAENLTEKVKYKLYRGDLVTEIHQTFNEYVSQVVRLYQDEEFVEFDWLVGPLPTSGPRGAEIISRFRTKLQTNATFYTDSNGREMLKRVRDARATWKLDLQEPVAGNYYPVTSKILMRDEEKGVEVAVLNDRAQGGSSLKDGEMELMVHRNCLHDDAFGVGEALMEYAYGQGLVAKGSHYLVVGETSKIASLERDLAQRKILQAWTFFSNTPKTEYDKIVKNFSGLVKSLPKNVQILTLEPWREGTFLLRLENVMEKSEDPQSVTVDLKDLLAQFEVISVKETTLGANQWLSDNERLKFSYKGEDLERDERYVVLNAEDGQNVTLEPMQIRTFVIEVGEK